ncbi:hypothetical protein LUZ61_008971 [Rhynchospora tenuis]|uniref:NB-ARC domain-containing protein n=1 Tax=Rhynchospora tenuis TaxID=198213 RepID=A0AAD6EXV2_9POAL|nr:hypothetical protein LUZ61_008971 [Rhynchospora tenuis]
MVGPELTVGGWFATSMIRNIIDMARSVLGSNHALQTEIEKRLTDLEKYSLPLLIATIEETSKSPTKNRGLIKWMDNLRNDAYNIRDALDDLEAKRFRESLKGKNKVTKFGYSTGKYLKTLIFSDDDLKAFILAVDKFSRNFKQLPEFINLLREYRSNANTENSKINRNPTSSFLDPNKKIFGRDLEIYFVLDIILNCQLVCSDQEMSNIDSIIGEQPFGMTTYGKEESSEVGRERKGEEKSNMKSSGEQNSVSIRNWKLPVLPICGTGGVGKTTVAQIVYNNQIVVERFDLRVWVYVPEKFNVVIIMKNIVDSVRASCSSTDTRTKSDSVIRQIIESELIETIRNKRFFLVFDDIPYGSESILNNDLFPVLGNGAPGSFVLVTTQSKRVSKTIGNMPIIILLDVLEPEWFDLLFKSYAFGELFSFNLESGSCLISCKHNATIAQVNNLTEDKLSYLESIATKIAEKLHGLPLAGRVIGNMLYNKLDNGQYWEEILKSNWWDNESTSQEILASLEIGYRDLGPELQQCFKFCSIFPKRYVFDKHILVQMWLAHDFDFVQPNEGESFKLNSKEIKLEDIGGERFDKLVERSFFQATVNDDKYVMHDVIRELAIAVSRKEDFYYVNRLDNKISNVITRHMGINCDGSNEEDISPICTNLRTVILFGNWIKYSDKSIRNIVGKSNSLRLLDLSYIGIKKNAPFYAISRQSHLRFVDLSFSGIDFIPDIFCALYHLQVLDVRGCEFKELSTHMNELINLRYLYASAETLSQISGIGKLTNLQELKEFRIGEIKGHRISELRDMNEISGHLHLTDLQNVTSKEEAATCQLAKKRYLKSLELTFSNKMDKFLRNGKLEQEVLEALKPSPSMEMLTIRGGGGDSLPGWKWSTQSGFSNLKCIKVCNFSLTTLPAFGELPSLEILSFDALLQVEMVGDEFYGHSDVVFPSLKELQFSRMNSWRTWSDAPAEKLSFPVLKKIDLHCNGLMEMPTNIFTSSVVEFTLSSLYGKFNNIETVLQRMPRLTHLSIAIVCNDLSINCTGLRFLEVLCLENVRHICFIGGSKSLVNLRKLDIARFEEIRESFEEEEENDGTYQENRFLTSLNLDYDYRSQILPLAGRLGYLRSLLIRNSPVTEYTEDEESWFSQLTSLETLEFSKCEKLKCLPSTLLLLTKLKKLSIVDCPEISSLPEFGSPENSSSLETLEFSSCRKLRGLPSTLPLLTKLKKLTIKSCRMITSLPESRLPRNLTELYITFCSDELMRRCQREPDEGDDWWKISHIPVVQIKCFKPFSFEKKSPQKGGPAYFTDAKKVLTEDH